MYKIYFEIINVKILDAWCAKKNYSKLVASKCSYKKTYN